MNPGSLLACAAAVAAAAVVSLVMAHGHSVGVISVSAQVTPSAVLGFEAKTPQLAISDEDIAQGYVDLAAGAFFKLSAGRFRPLLILDFSPAGGLVKSIELKSDGSAYRFYLADKLVPGRSVVPLTLNVEL